MNSRERILKTLNHQEPDRIPFDLAGTPWSGISNTAYQNLRMHMGLEQEDPDWSDVIQQIVIPSADILSHLKVDTRGLFPLTSHNWGVYEKLDGIKDAWEYKDEWGFVHNFPRNDGRFFSIIKNPLDDVTLDPTTIDTYPWPKAADLDRIAGLYEKAVHYRSEGKLVLIKGICAGLFEMHQRIRGVANAIMDPMLFPEFSDKLIAKIADLKIEFWEMVLNELCEVVDVVCELDDYGTQESQLISPDQFRKYYKPHIRRVLGFIREKAPNVRILFHSCGNVRPIIPDLMDMGVDILNPVHINAKGMEPAQLKKDFGNDLVFWGGGIDTQEVLPRSSKNDISDEVRRNIDVLAPGGGFVFSCVHNIQAEVPAENIMTMWEALRLNSEY
jgi:uroporphyrinogen decarboxylase